MAAKRQKRAGAVPLESAEQSAVVGWWAHFCKSKGIDERLLIASANGAVLGGDKRLRAIRSSILKKQGVRAGTPDLTLYVARRGFHGLIVEMKRIKGSDTSDEQLELHYLLRMQGYNVVVCHGADEAIRAISVYLSGHDQH